MVRNNFLAIETCYWPQRKYAYTNSNIFRPSHNITTPRFLNKNNQTLTTFFYTIYVFLRNNFCTKFFDFEITEITVEIVHNFFLTITTPNWQQYHIVTQITILEQLIHLQFKDNLLVKHKVLRATTFFCQNICLFHTQFLNYIHSKNISHIYASRKH